MKLNNIFAFLNKPIKNKHIKYGVPFLGFLAVGLAVIRECATVRYQFGRRSTLESEELKRLGLSITDKRETLEEAYEEYCKIDLDNWENVRGPRLWDETPQN